MRKAAWLEFALLLLVMCSALGAVVAYAAKFRRFSLGGPASWSDFGDYFSGVLNPVIGIATVILVVITIRTTRDEAAVTRGQMQTQILQLEKQARLADMQKRLDGLLEEWNRLLEQIAPSGFQSLYLRGPEHSSSQHTVREVIEDEQRRAKLVIQNLKGEDTSSGHWLGFKHNLVPLLCELDSYCVEYEREVGNDLLTKFYKARVRDGLRTLVAANLIPASVSERLLQS